MKSKKVMVIGLDGGTLDLIKPWVEQGELPYLAEIMSNGTYGKLRSTLHPLTAPAWTSFMTGKNPGKHGLFDFIERLPSSYGIRYTNSKSRKAESLWSILSRMGKKVIVVNVPLTFPVEEVNGLLISGMNTPDENSDFTHPQGLYSEIKKAIGKYIITTEYSERYGRKKHINDINEMIDIRASVAKYLMNNHQWDFMMVVFNATDIVQHSYWKYMDKGHPDHNPDEARQYKNVILNVHKRIDEKIGEFMSSIDSDTTLLIMSDHGAGPFHKAVYINNWLYQNDFLRFKNRAVDSTWKIRDILCKEGLSLCKRAVPKGVKAFLKRRYPDMNGRVNSLLFSSGIDWPNTKAFSGGVHGSIIINLKGREPSGIVNPGNEYEEVRNQIISALYRLKDPDTQKNIVEKVHKREEIYHGKYVDKAPDLLIEWKDYSYMAQFDDGSADGSAIKTRDRFEFSKKEHSGSHRLEGMFIIKSKHIYSNKVLSGARIIDLAPTILYVMDLAIPDDMDGKVLSECFVNEYRLSHPVGYTKVSNETCDYEPKSTYSKDEADKIRDRLRGLGYL